MCAREEMLIQTGATRLKGAQEAGAAVHEATRQVGVGQSG